MPFPRRVLIYLREKKIPANLVEIVRVSDPGDGNEVVDTSYPPRPAGSLPILTIASEQKDENDVPKEQLHVRQSMAIIYFLEEMCEKQMYGFPPASASFYGKSTIERVRVNEVLSLAEECTVAWYVQSVNGAASNNGLLTDTC
jgi:hypothetical protein